MRLPASSSVPVLAPLPVPQPYLPALTGVRVVAAYLVCLHHFNPFGATTGLGGLLRRVVAEFHVGVPVFFVLSGFLITLRYFAADAGRAQPWGPYLRNRVARIYPLYLLLTAAAFAVLYQRSGTFDWQAWWLNLTLLRGFFAEYLYSGIPQGWTLTVEECFYLTAPLALRLLRHLPRALWLLPLGLLGMGAALVALLARLGAYGLMSGLPFMLLFTFFGRATEFFVGVQLARWYGSGQQRLGTAPGGRTAWGVVLMAAVVAALVAVGGQEQPLGIGLNNFVLPGAVAVWFAGLLTEDSWLRRLLSTPLFQVLGKSSYAFYLVHFGPIQEWLHAHVTANRLGLFLLLNLLAVALHYGVEQPLNRWLRARPGRARVS